MRIPFIAAHPAADLAARRAARLPILLAPLAVLVVDDQPIVRDGIASLIASAAIPLRQLDTAATPAEALCAAARLQPDVVVLDVDLAGADGLALIPHLAPAAVLVLSCHGDAATRARALRLGAGAFVEKHQPAADLLGALLRLVTAESPQLQGEKAPPGLRAASQVGAVTSSDVLKVIDL